VHAYSADRNPTNVRHVLHRPSDRLHGQALLRYVAAADPDYCDVFLTHDSTSGTYGRLTAVRKAHNCGRNHLQNVRDYYAAMAPADMQAVLDSIRREYEKRGMPPPIELVAPHVAYRLPPPSLMPNGTYLALTQAARRSWAAPRCARHLACRRPT